MAKTGSAQRRVTLKKIKRLTFGVTDALTNVALYLLYVTLEMPGGRGPAGVHRAFDQADELIAELDAKKLRRALYNLHQQGLVSSIKGAVKVPKITKAGIRRIKSRFPFYDEERVWDGKIYLINYDIPVDFNRQRNLLRRNLERFKAVSLQDSLYLTPYNPRELIDLLTEENNIQGYILVSTLNPREAFGSSNNLKKVLWEVYEMDEVNQRYSWFIDEYSRINKEEVKKQRMQIAFAYMSVLQSDPQLPFELLPDRYLGDEAYLLFRRLVVI